MVSPSVPPRTTAAVVVTLSTKTRYTADEEIAFRHVRHYLSRYDQYVLIPDDHPAIYPGFIPKRFAPRFFGSAQAHGRLLLSEAFYRAFLDYEYILIYHLDALVFADELLEWCGAGYDFIGAPWLRSPDTPHITAQKVGNGGFSLRRVRSFLRVLRSKAYFVDPDEYWRRYCERSGPLARAVNWPRKHVKRLGWFNDVRWHVKWAVHGDVHEDRFWAEYATQYDPAFRIAPVDVAMRFAFEAEPRACFERIGRRMPFGAHRWQTFDRAFYEPHLLRHGAASEVRPDAPRDARLAWNRASVARVAARSLLPSGAAQP
ncbi:MAG: DUF5672 family protein [Vicinamibacterales bacterium]